MYQDKINEYKNKYEWKLFNFPVSAQNAGEEIERLTNAKGGKIEAMDIVNISRNKTDILHNCFEWNDAIAAEKHREQTARKILTNLVIKEIEIDGKIITEQTRAFVNISISENDSQRKYLSIQSVLNDENYKKSLLENALKELQSFQKKYKSLKELSSVFNAIEKIIEPE